MNASKARIRNKSGSTSAFSSYRAGQGTTVFDLSRVLAGPYRTTWCRPIWVHGWVPCVRRAGDRPVDIREAPTVRLNPTRHFRRRITERGGQIQSSGRLAVLIRVQGAIVASHSQIEEDADEPHRSALRRGAMSAMSTPAIREFLLATRRANHQRKAKSHQLA